MDYKKAYEEMVQRARELHKGGNALTKQQMEIVCPELAESEDERIIEGFYTLLRGIRRDGGLTLNKVPLDKCEVWLEKQKEQKAVKQDAGLYDAVDDYVRDHFIAGADFTPEYIKKLMENAFFAGVDYILLKEEGEL